MGMKRLLFFISLSAILLLVSCIGNEYKIEKLPSQKVEFSNLPIQVKDFFYYPSEYTSSQGEFYVGNVPLICIGNKGQYRYESIDTWIGPWISHYKIHDDVNKISYRIEHGYASPFIIFQKQLYIPLEYNIMMGTNSFESAEFQSYQLK